MTAGNDSTRARRTPQEIAETAAEKAFDRVTKARAKADKAETAAREAKAEVERVERIARYATQHPDLPENVREAYAAEFEDAVDEDEGVISEPVGS